MSFRGSQDLVKVPASSFSLLKVVSVCKEILKTAYQWISLQTSVLILSVNALIYVVLWKLHRNSKLYLHFRYSRRVCAARAWRCPPPWPRWSAWPGPSWWTWYGGKHWSAFTVHFSWPRTLFQGKQDLRLPFLVFSCVGTLGVAFTSLGSFKLAWLWFKVIHYFSSFHSSRDEGQRNISKCGWHFEVGQTIQIFSVEDLGINANFRKRS